jgi:hypothetical protein
MAEQLSLLSSGEGRIKLWFRATDLLGRPLADVPVHECEGGWHEAAMWCYLEVQRINASIRFAFDIEQAAREIGGLPQGRQRHVKLCCSAGPFDRHHLAHLTVRSV